MTKAQNKLATNLTNIKINVKQSIKIKANSKY